MNTLDLVYVGIRGSVVALDRNSGRRIWEAHLKGSSFVTVLVDGNCVFAGTQGEIFCLDAGSGRILWQDGLKGYGLGLVSIATQNGCSNPAAAAAEISRQQQASSAAASTAVVAAS
jgi:outer membrane protein assembly factor BamB